MPAPVATKKPRVNMARAWAEARALIWKHRQSLSVGLALMLVNRLAGLVLPASSKYLIDDVLGKHQLAKLVPLALAVGGATVVQAITSFSLSQIVSIAAQRAISDMRIEVQRHILRLPVSFFDATKSGVLMTFVVSAAILSTTARGVPAGANQMNHDRELSRSTPDSASVGTSGKTDERCDPP